MMLYLKQPIIEKHNSVITFLKGTSGMAVKKTMADFQRRPMMRWCCPSTTPPAKLRGLGGLETAPQPTHAVQVDCHPLTGEGTVDRFMDGKCNIC